MMEPLDAAVRFVAVAVAVAWPLAGLLAWFGIWDTDDEGR